METVAMLEKFYFLKIEQKFSAQEIMWLGIFC